MKHEHLPHHLQVEWIYIRIVSTDNYPRAMQLAAAWGKRLAEWEMGQ